MMMAPAERTNEAEGRQRGLQGRLAASSPHSNLAVAPMDGADMQKQCWCTPYTTQTPAKGFSHG